MLSWNFFDSYYSRNTKTIWLGIMLLFLCFQENIFIVTFLEITLLWSDIFFLYVLIMRCSEINFCGGTGYIFFAGSIIIKTFINKVSKPRRRVKLLNHPSFYQDWDSNFQNSISSGQDCIEILEIIVSIVWPVSTLHWNLKN